jgi:hypothetical protein
MVQEGSGAMCRMPPAASKGSAAKEVSQGPMLRAGMLVEFQKEERAVLGLVLEADGKKNWWIADQVHTSGRHAHSSGRPGA